MGSIQGIYFRPLEEDVLHCKWFLPGKVFHADTLSSGRHVSENSMDHSYRVARCRLSRAGYLLTVASTGT